jgi:hypothetical protein
MIEFYEMVSVNDCALRGAEKLAILKARLALGMFERAMQSLKAEFSLAPAETESSAGPGGQPLNAWSVGGAGSGLTFKE